MTALRTVMMRNAALAGSSTVRPMCTSMRTFNKKEDPDFQAGVPESMGEGSRDLVAEQVNRIGEAAPMSVVSGAPNSLHQRVVRIYKPNKSATTSGKGGTREWRVDFDALAASGRWENPLMGWASTADHQQALSMKFDEKEDAVHFCQKQGWDFFIQEPHKAHIPPKSYSDIFKYAPGKLRIFQTK
ncbi:ndufs4 NADH dehydrogenase Fe-S protein subunit [Malassezia vespertilionis]|nr:ndufs4 NADH dehydrogenase Fe-S protein subunit [Malassezia vespertilionis]WFD07231.1 ndufs4 NADH dehydrogenase Fe-S protein subunit [Malassezia vespertilionis]